MFLFRCFFKSGEFLGIISFPLLLFLSSSGTPIMHADPLEDVPQIPWTFFTFLHSLFFVPQTWQLFYLLVHWFFSYSNLSWLPSSECFIQAIVLFNFMAAVTICSDFGAPKNKVWLFPHLFPPQDLQAQLTPPQPHPDLSDCYLHHSHSSLIIFSRGDMAL